MQLKEKAKDARQKQKDSEEQYKKQQMNLCGEFLEHAFTAACVGFSCLFHGQNPPNAKPTTTFYP